MYFRYADDQMILLNDPHEVERLLLLLTRRLDRDGLRVNQKKIALSTAHELQEHRCRSIQSLFAEKGDNKQPSLVKKFVEAYLAIPKDDLANTWNQGVPLLNRLLYANLESLPKTLFQKITDRLASEQYLLVATHKKLERIHFLNSKRSKPLNLTERLRKLAQANVHNAFHNQVLAFANLIKDGDLRDFVAKRLEAIDKLMEQP